MQFGSSSNLQYVIKVLPCHFGHTEKPLRSKLLQAWHGVYTFVGILMQLYWKLHHGNLKEQFQTNYKCLPQWTESNGAGD